MVFDRKYYNEIKKFTLGNLNKMDFRLKGKFKTPFDWAKTFLPLIVTCAHEEDYEGAQAITDAIREFLNSFIEDKTQHIKKTDTLKLPDYVETKINGIICYQNGTA